MRRPNRLDAHAYEPQRTSAPTFQDLRGPYLVYDEPWEDYCPELQASVKRLRLQRLRDEPSDVEATVIKNDGQIEFLHRPHTELPI